MTDELQSYYNKELAFIRQMGAEFSRENSKIAGRLGIYGDTIEDPHVSRLIESFAYLNARIQHRLDDDLPEVSNAMMEVLFPHYHRPFPSMSIVQFEADREKLDAGFSLPRGTLLDTELFQGESCRFATVYDTKLYPFEVNNARVLGKPFNTPGAAQSQGANGVVRISLKTFNPEILFSELQPGSIRFYLQGQPQHVHPLYELLLSQATAVYLATSGDDTSPVFLPTSCVKAVGFEENQGLIPYPPGSFLGYRLLTEYFAFPEKFMFFEITGLKDKIPDTAQDSLDLYIYLGESDIELEHNVSASTFQLGCSPAANLFEHRSDPIKLTHTDFEYEVVPDARRPSGYEIYSIERVRATDSSGKSETYPPLYGIDHVNQRTDHGAYWFSRRQHAKLGNNQRDEATDVFISLVDRHFNPNRPDDRILMLETLCSNRDQPAKLPFSAEQPRLQAVDGAPPCSAIRCLTRPSPAARPSMRNDTRWKLISHLSLNHLSLTGREDACTALKELLMLYDFRNLSSNRAQIDSITDIKTSTVTASMPIDGRNSLCRGIRIEIELDNLKLSGSCRFLFATILEHFFALYSSINSFTKVMVRLKDHEGYLKACPPRTGEKTLL